MNNVNFLLHDKYFTQHFLLLVFKLCAFFIFAILEIVNTCKNFVLGAGIFPSNMGPSRWDSRNRQTAKQSPLVLMDGEAESRVKVAWKLKKQPKDLTHRPFVEAKEIKANKCMSRVDKWGKVSCNEQRVDLRLSFCKMPLVYLIPCIVKSIVKKRLS